MPLIPVNERYCVNTKHPCFFTLSIVNCTKGPTLFTEPVFLNVLKRSPEINSKELIPPGWEWIPGFLERFTNKGSGLPPSTENLWKTRRRSARGVLVEKNILKLEKYKRKE
jgi:hypothetical protein